MFRPYRSLNQQRVYIQPFSNIRCTLVDKDDNIWLGFDYGEWSGDIYVFSTKLGKFLLPNFKNFEPELNPVFSFTQGDSAVFFSGGLSHLGDESGFIGRFQNLTATVDYQSRYNMRLSDTPTTSSAYLGPIAFDKTDNSFLIYTDNGFFRCTAEANLARPKAWVQLPEVALNWTYGQPKAIGRSMNVSKLEVLDGDRMLFLTGEDGIGYYDGKSIRMFL